ncbi:hypothetical protein CMI37_33995 [Candidatus Pacearchaeota archaeon]|nr:hypothetical protein [Candidatus Pacearchaeota archaeon]|tara:strand:+ start:1672 stop:2019 length:348 start_codon:yes stop_codon:yes gene_type:complete
MWINIISNTTFNRGDVVEYSGGILSALSAPTVAIYGVVGQIVDREDGTFTIRLHTAGDVMAKASRIIPDDGGALGMETGGVYVDASPASPIGIISPLVEGQSSRVVGDLVLVHLR